MRCGQIHAEDPNPKGRNGLLGSEIQVHVLDMKPNVHVAKCTLAQCHPMHYMYVQESSQNWKLKMMCTQLTKYNWNPSSYSFLVVKHCLLAVRVKGEMTEHAEHCTQVVQLGIFMISSQLMIWGHKWTVEDYYIHQMAIILLNTHGITPIFNML